MTTTRIRIETALLHAGLFALAHPRLMLVAGACACWLCAILDWLHIPTGTPTGETGLVGTSARG